MAELFRRNSFFWRRLHSLTGVLPVGFFLVFHLYANWTANQGPEVYYEHVKFINSLPGLWFLEVFGIFIPLYFHGLYGIYIAMDARHNVLSYPFWRNWAFFFQRLSGLITLAFVTQHIYHFRVQKALGTWGPENPLPTFEIVRDGLSNPVMRIWYAIGIVAAAYHLANGLYTFLITWGITRGPRSQRISNVATNVLFVLIAALGLSALRAFR
ncbi:MAG: succinate dehydrogenase cytochrome b558 subunit [Bacillota bacterium]|nr:MAG: succinate dehydrogenase [Bacillota bacterium]